MGAQARAGEGYWGPPTSTVDWCESNYIVTHYVAELLNSSTSFFIVAAGLLPLALHRQLWPLLEVRYLLACLSVCVVGLGSVAFHGTLLFQHQMWDEVPMLWTVVVFLFCLLEHHEKSRRYGPAFPITLAAYAAFATYATSQQDGNAQWFSFHTLFAAVELPCLYLWYRFFKDLDESESLLRNWMMRGFYCYVLAIVVWMTDLNFCSTLQTLPAYDYWNFHAFGWHLLVSCGLYIGVVGLWYHRLRHVLLEKVALSSGALLRIQHESPA